MFVGRMKDFFPRRIRLACCAALLAITVQPAPAQDPCQPNRSNVSPGGAETNAPCESQPPPFRLLNIAGRARVQRDERALIGGFIIDGALPVRVIIRGIGTSLTKGDSPLAGRLLNPALELRGASGELITENDDWRASPQADQIRTTGLAPREHKEAAIVATLEPGAYTSILRGSGETEGIGVIEIYDLQTSADAKLSNLASRAFVSTGDNILIGGLIIQGGPPQPVLLRAIGTSLAGTVPQELQDPTIELVDAQGMKLGENNDWKDSSDAAAIQGSGAAPTSDKEAAILVSLSAGPYTATMRGANGSTGTGVVEIYRLD